jgi:CRP/FNR family transcriptional regulator, anaerobic regulatory protein
MLFLDTIKSYYTLSLPAQAFLSSNIEVLHLPKNKVLVSEGQVCNQLFFIIEGIARAFHHKNGNDITTLFAKTGDFIYLIDSFLHQNPATESIELLEPSTVVTIKSSVLNELYQNYPETNIIGRLITEKYLWMYDQRIKMLRDYKASVRLTSFIEIHSDIFERVPKQHIASYLGTTPETVSRFLSQKRKDIR